MYPLTDLHEERLERVVSVLRGSGARRVLDLGCGVGLLLQRLVGEPQFTEIVGLESSPEALAEGRLALADALRADDNRLTLLQGSYTEQNERLCGYDAAAMVETIEHVEPGELSNVEQAVFGQYRPGSLFMTTPNSEYNPLFGLAPNQFREEGHRFEWSRARFRRWASGVAQRNGYRVRFGGIGEAHPELGQPSQTALFSLVSSGHWDSLPAHETRQSQ